MFSSMAETSDFLRYFIRALAWTFFMRAAAACGGRLDSQLGSPGWVDLCLSGASFSSGPSNQAADHLSHLDVSCAGGSGIGPDLREQILGGSVKIQETPGEVSDTSNVVYEVRLAPGKGLGVFATTFIPRGTAILIEAPLVKVSMPDMVQGQGFRIADMISDIDASFALLTLEQKAEFLSLHDFRFPAEENQSHLMTIFRSNAYNTGEESVGLFPKIARINHSCRPNAGNWWSEAREKRNIFAVRDIREGEEITVSYIPLLKTTADRQARLQQYGFTCDCTACQSAEGDEMRVKILELLELLEEKLHSMSKKDATNERLIEKALALVEMIGKEELMDYMARAFRLAAVFNKRRGHLGAAEAWARKELEVLRWAEEDSSEVIAALEFIDSLRNEQWR